MGSGTQPQNDCDNSVRGDQNMVARFPYISLGTGPGAPVEFKYILNVLSLGLFDFIQSRTSAQGDLYQGTIASCVVHIFITGCYS